MKNPFKKTELEKPTSTEKLFNVSISKLEQESIVELKTRHENLIKDMHALKPLALESLQEKAKRLRKYKEADDYITKLIQKKEQQEKEERIKAAREYVHNTIPQILRDLRFATQGTNLLKSGFITTKNIKWQKPQDTTLKLKTSSKRTVKFDLLKMHPEHLKFIIENPLHAMFFTIEAIAVKDGKQITSLWQSHKFEEMQKIQPITDTVLALMYVG